MKTVSINHNFNYVQEDTGKEKFFTRENANEALEFITAQDLETFEKNGLITINKSESDSPNARLEH